MAVILLKIFSAGLGSSVIWILSIGLEFLLIWFPNFYPLDGDLVQLGKNVLAVTLKHSTYLIYLDKV